MSISDDEHRSISGRNEEYGCPQNNLVSLDALPILRVDSHWVNTVSIPCITYSAFGSAIPFPHILYSALSVCRPSCHFARLSRFARIALLGALPLIPQKVV